MKIISRSEAMDSGLKTYFTGKPCPHGHLAEKRVRDKYCLECHKIDKAKYKKSLAWKIQAKKDGDKYRANPKNKIKISVRNLVTEAIKRGRLTRKPCEKCGSTYRIHAHHEDYSKPLEVMWLCTKHHYDRHKELEKGK